MYLFADLLGAAQPREPSASSERCAEFVEGGLEALRPCIAVAQVRLFFNDMLKETM